MTPLLIFSLFVFTINSFVFFYISEETNSSSIFDRKLLVLNTYIYGAIIIISIRSGNYDLVITILVRTYTITLTILITLIQILKHYAKP